MKTAITELFNIEHPIIQGGMHYVGFAELAGAVSNAGGLGIITGLTQRTPELLAKEIAKCHELTDKPFGVNLTFLPSFSAPPYPEYIAAIREGGIKIVETAGRSPEQYMPALKAAGIKVIHKCTSVRHSLKAEQIGCDAVSVDGFECGGHPGEDDMPNMILLPRAAEELKIPFVASGGMADARSLVASLAMGAAGIKVIHKCTSVRHSLKAESIGCDAVSVDGFECGGHPGEDDMPNMILLPRAAEELKIPFVASGGMADARSLVASLAMGASGINMGTRFIATKEAPVHENVKQALVKASELDTRLIMRALRNTERVLKNAGVERLLEIEREKGRGLKIEDIHDQVAGVYPKVMIDGDMEAGAWSCGMVVGLIHDIPSVKELIDRIMVEADRIIRGRLMGFLDDVSVKRPIRAAAS